MLESLPVPDDTVLASPQRFSTFAWVWTNLTARPLRSTLSMIAVCAQVVLILMVTGLTSGIVWEWAKRVEGVGADILVQPPNASIFFTFSGGVMQESLAAQIAALPGVDEVAPTLVLTDPGNFGLVYGIDFGRFNALSTGFLFLAGGPFQGPYQALADDIVVQTRHLKIGDTVHLLNRDFTIAGIVAHGKGARYFIPLKTAQDIAGAEGRASLLYVRSKGDTEGTRAQIVKLLPTYRVRTMSEYLTLMNSSSLPEIKPFVHSMVGLGVVVSFLVVLLTMNTMVLERTREIGILKALGLSRGAILRLLLGEAWMMAAIGSLAGIGLSLFIRVILRETVPTLTVLLSSRWMFDSIWLALAAASAGALFPALRAARFDPVEALAYE
jgi:putative ABC transport system permease protein